MTGAGDAVRDVPLVGDKIADAVPEGQAGRAPTIEQAGTDLVDAVTQLANILGWVTALVPIIIVGLVWLVLRGRFVRRASAAPAVHRRRRRPRPVRAARHGAPADAQARGHLARTPRGGLAAWRAATIRLRWRLLRARDTGTCDPPRRLRAGPVTARPAAGRRARR